MQVASNMGISIVLLTYNTSIDLLKTCIDSIIKHNDIADALEIIITDNNSDNQEAINLFAEAYAYNLKVVNSKHNGGYGSGNNLGIRAASHEIVLLVNPDVELIEPMFRWALQEFQTKQHLNILGMQQINQYNVPTHSFLARRLTVNCFLANFVLQKVNKFNAKYSVVSGACFFLRRSSFLEIGGYDEQIFLYGEERYLHERMLQVLPHSLIELDSTKKYKHPITDRAFSLRIAELGLTSYFYLCQQLGISKLKTFREVKRYYRFLLLFYFLKNKKETMAQTREILGLLKRKFTP